jgi:hypothetical protein
LPENYEAYILFTNMQTQWRTGMSGATGLDYNALKEVWQRLKIPLDRRDELFQDLRIMENAALKTMREKKA